MLSASANASYVIETWHKNTNVAVQGIKSGEGKQVYYREPQCFPQRCTGILQVVQTPRSSPHPLKPLRGVGRVQKAQGRVKTKTFASGNSQCRLETEQALYGFLTSHPPTLRSLMDTSGGSLFFYQSQICFKSMLCRLSVSLGGPDLDRCKKFSERTGNFHHLTPSESVRSMSQSVQQTG